MLAPGIAKDIASAYIQEYLPTELFFYQLLSLYTHIEEPGKTQGTKHGKTFSIIQLPKRTI